MKFLFPSYRCNWTDTQTRAIEMKRENLPKIFVETGSFPGVVLWPKSERKKEPNPHSLRAGKRIRSAFEITGYVPHRATYNKEANGGTNRAEKCSFIGYFERQGVHSNKNMALGIKRVNNRYNLLSTSLFLIRIEGKWEIEENKRYAKRKMGDRRNLKK